MSPPRSVRWVESRLVDPRGGAGATFAGEGERGLWVRHRGASMAPALCDGDRLRVEAGPPRPGEIALARRGARLVAHRVVRVEGGRPVLRGDAADACDPPLPDGGAAGMVLGRVVEVERAGRRFPPPPRSWRSSRAWRALRAALRRLAARGSARSGAAA